MGAHLHLSGSKFPEQARDCSVCCVLTELVCLQPSLQLSQKSAALSQLLMASAGRACAEQRFAHSAKRCRSTWMGGWLVWD